MADRRSNEGRRNGFERRSRRDKQRDGYETTAVVEITTSELRVAILEQRGNDSPDLVQASTTNWKDASTSFNSEEGMRELSEALSTLVEEHSLQTAGFHFVLGGELCVTKTVRGSSEEVRDELRKIEERSRLYLSLGPGEKVMVSNKQAIDARHDYAVAAVCNQRTLNNIHAAATSAGIEAVSIEPALVSVNRAVSRLPDTPSEPYLMMHVDGEAVEVGVCHEGKLLLEFRPAGRGESSDIGEVLHTHLSRLKRHAGRVLRSAPPKLNIVYLCGDQDSVQQTLRRFESHKEFQVRVIAPSRIQATWEMAQEVEGSAIVPALGRLLCSYLPKNEHAAPNFMKHIIASTRDPVGPIIVRSLIPLAAVLLVAVAGFLFNWQQSGQVAVLQTQLDELEGAKARHRELRLKLTSIEQKVKQQKRLLSALKTTSSSHLVQRVGHCMPSDVWLNDLTIVEMNTIKLSGSSLLESGVFDFTEWLDQAPEFNDVALKSTSPGNSPSGPIVDFNLEINFDGSVDTVKEVASNE